MKVCPNNAMHPTLTEAGLEGMWTPTLVPRIGYCEPSCVLCSEVCPTGAIWQITPKRKRLGGGRRQPSTTANPHRDGFLRPRPLPALGHGHRLHCLRRVVPGLAQGHILAGGDVIDSAGNTKTSEAAARRSQPLRGLRRLRVRVPAAGAPRGLRHQHRRKPLPGKPDSAQPQK